MKNPVIAFLFIFSILIYFGCSENNPVEPQVTQSDQATTSLEKLGKKSFTGTSKVVKPIDPGKTTELPNGYILIEKRVVEWYDKVTDPRMTGRTIWTVDQLIKPNGVVNYGGTTELIVDNCGGKWEMWWYGTIVGGIGVAHAYSMGVEGDVKGLYARSTYRIDLTVGPPPASFYEITGFIIGKRTMLR